MIKPPRNPALGSKSSRLHEELAWKTGFASFKLSYKPMQGCRASLWLHLSRPLDSREFTKSLHFQPERDGVLGVKVLHHLFLSGALIHMPPNNLDSKEVIFTFSGCARLLFPRAQKQTGGSKSCSDILILVNSESPSSYNNDLFLLLPWFGSQLYGHDILQCLLFFTQTKLFGYSWIIFQIFLILYVSTKLRHFSLESITLPICLFLMYHPCEGMWVEKLLYLLTYKHNL